MSAPKIAVVFGTRPETIKMAPVVKELERRGVDHTVIVTAQHRGMLDQMLEVFQIRPAHFVERHGALLIVALGESVAAVGIGAARHQHGLGVLRTELQQIVQPSGQGVNRVKGVSF